MRRALLLILAALFAASAASAGVVLPVLNLCSLRAKPSEPVVNVASGSDLTSVASAYCTSGCDLKLSGVFTNVNLDLHALGVPDDAFVIESADPSHPAILKAKVDDGTGNVIAPVIDINGGPAGAWVENLELDGQKSLQPTSIVTGPSSARTSLSIGIRVNNPSSTQIGGPCIYGVTAHDFVSAGIAASDDTGTVVEGGDFYDNGCTVASCPLMAYLGTDSAEPFRITPGYGVNIEDNSSHAVIAYAKAHGNTKIGLQLYTGNGSQPNVAGVIYGSESYGNAVGIVANGASAFRFIGNNSHDNGWAGESGRQGMGMSVTGSTSTPASGTVDLNTLSNNMGGGLAILTPDGTVYGVRNTLSGNCSDQSAPVNDLDVAPSSSLASSDYPTVSLIRNTMLAGSPACVSGLSVQRAKKAYLEGNIASGTWSTRGGYLQSSAVQARDNTFSGTWLIASNNTGCRERNTATTITDDSSLPDCTTPSVPPVPADTPTITLGLETGTTVTVHQYESIPDFSFTIDNQAGAAGSTLNYACGPNSLADAGGSAGTSWITASSTGTAASSDAPVTLTEPWASVASSGAVGGPYTGNFRCADSNASNSPQDVPLSLTIVPNVESTAAPTISSGVTEPASLTATSNEADTEGDPVSCAWTMPTKPAGDAGSFADANACDTTYGPTVAGTYGAHDVVTDNLGTHSGNGYDTATETVASSSGGSGTIVAAIRADQFSTVAPAAVFFDARGSTDGSTSAADLFRFVQYAWDFNDPAAGSWSYGNSQHASKATDLGPVTGHVYETAGTFLPSVTATNGAGNVDSSAATVTVQDPDTVFAGALTTCVSTNGDFAGCPSGAAQVTTSASVQSILSAYLGAGLRVLFHRGQGWTLTGTYLWSNAGPSQVGAFGSGAKPAWSGSYGGRWIDFVSGSASGTIMDIQANGGDVLGSIFVSTDSASGHQTKGLLVLRVDMSHFEVFDGMTEDTSTVGTSNINTGVAFVDCTMQDRMSHKGANDSFAGGDDLLFLGNDIGNEQGEEHGLRIPYADGLVISHNRFQFGGPSAKSVIKIHNREGGSAGCTQGIEIADNDIDPGNAQIVAGIGPQDLAHVNACVEIGRIERNWIHFAGTADGTSYVWYMGGPHWLIRDNILNPDLPGFSTAPPLARFVTSSSAVYPPTDEYVEHNTYFTGQARTPVLAACSTGASSLYLYNNLMYCPSGTCTTGGCGTEAGNVVATSNPFAANPPSAVTDYELLSGSAPVDAGSSAALPLPGPDFSGTASKRPSGSASDAGAWER